MALGLADYQFNYAGPFDSMTFGPNGATVPNVDIEEVSGLMDLDVRIGDREFAREHGDIAGLHRAEPREVRLKIEVRSNTLNQTYYDLVTRTRELFSAIREPDSTQILTFKLPGEPEQIIRCRPIRRREPRNWKTEYGLLPMEILLRAADPRIYSVDFVDSGAQTGTFNVTNAGNSHAYPELHFGAITAATVTNNTNGTEVVITGATNGSGNLRANMDRWIRGVNNDNIIERGSNDNYFAWQQPRSPLYLDPGTNSLTVSVSTQVFHRNTWL